MPRMTPPRGYTRQDTKKRKEWLLERTGLQINELPADPPEALRGIIENHVGTFPMPMSVSGPLRVSGTYAQGEFYVPLCTMEGTLTMSMTRGALLTALSGGIKTRHLKQELSRSPIFIFEDIGEAVDFRDWTKAAFDKIKVAAESTTRHGKLLRIDSYIFKNNVILDFMYDTAEAAGQNMVTIATHRACQFIHEQYSHSKFKYYIECNFNCDKNPAHKTLLLGRGHQVVASSLIKGKLLKRMLRSTAEEYVQGWNECTRGAQMAGVVGMNMHVANALAAIYLATGQDVACVAENAVGIMEFEVRNEVDLYASLTMPSISVGTVGGGTRLAQPQKNLELLGCTGKHSSRKLAEIVCAGALALELSLGGAIVSDEFAKSHAEFGRGE